MKPLNQVFRTLIVTASLWLSVPAYGGWLESVSRFGHQSLEKSKTGVHQTLHTGKLAGHKAWETTLKTKQYSLQLGSKAWSGSKIGWHRAKVIAKP